MPGRTRRRFGAIRKLPSGRWQVRYRDAAGTLIPAPLTFDTKTDAGKYLTKLEADQLRGQWIDPQLGRTPFGEWVEQWRQTTADLRANTRDGYEITLRRYLLPRFESRQLVSIDTMTVRVWLAELAAAGVGASTRAKAYRLLGRILALAVEARYIPVNPCAIKGAAVERSPEMRVATVDQVARLAAAVPPWYRAMILLAAYGGLRWGELAGLCRQHVDLAAGTVTVARQLLEVNGSLTVGPPKSDAGRRTVTLPRVVVDALAEHLATYVPADPDAYIFRTEENGSLRRSNFRRRVWVPATRTAGVEGLRFHDLRHTAGTLAAVAGGTLREVMDRLGHSSAAAALRYQHVSANRDAAIARALDAMLDGEGDGEGTKGRRSRGAGNRSGTDVARPLPKRTSEKRKTGPQDPV